jgi:hypothetical protein
MPHNPILEEVYAARVKLLAEHNGDVHSYVEAARKRALASERPIAEPKQRTDQSAKAEESDVAAAEDQTSPSR